MDNAMVIAGNVTQVPELRYSHSGLAVLNFSVAVNRRWTNRQTGELEESVHFQRVTAWDRLAENVANSIDRGDRVMVTGRVETQSWETPEGESRSNSILVADEVGISLKWATAEAFRNPKEDQS